MKNDVFSPGDTPTSASGCELVCLFNALKQSIKVVIISLRASYICCLYEIVNDSPWCVKFSQFSYIGKLSGIVGGPGGGGASGVWCCEVCVDRLSTAMLCRPPPFLRSASSHMLNSSSCKSKYTLTTTKSRRFDVVVVYREQRTCNLID